MFKDNNILDIYQINKYFMTAFMYKCQNNFLLEVLSDMYITKDSTRQE